MEARNSELRLVGTTESVGGRFRQVRIVGECVLAGDTQCEKFAATGTVRVKGSLDSENVKITGELKVDGDLLLGKAAITGEADVRGSCRGEEIKLTGGFKIKGDLESESCKIGGAAVIGGLLSAETVELRMHGPCEAREIGGGGITVKRNRFAKLKGMFGTANAAVLKAELIEGDRLDLEHVKAKVVRGNEVRIGPGCEIGRVEYAKSQTKSRSASVGAEVKNE
jgi:cytoskeletal protein CcmA (bactofilin family)